MTIGAELFDLLSAAAILMFIGKLVFSREEGILSTGTRREKVSLLNQHIMPRARTA